MYQLLSYPITLSDPAWPKSPQLTLEPYLSIDGGDSANTYMVRFYNHTGTHYDAPNHFVPGGKQISELPLSRFIYEHPLLLDVPKEACEKINPEDLAPYAAQIAQCDLLMLRTGFSRYRTGDPGRYEADGPAISSVLASYLVSEFPGLAAIAVDFVSLASYRDQKDGNRAHQILLGEGGGHFICGIEDVNMASIKPEKLRRVFAMPLFIKGVDSGPVTMVAEMDS